MQENHSFYNTYDENEQGINPYRYAAIYARQSSKSDSFSIPSQIEDCKRHLTEKNLLLYNVYEDKESGRKDLETRKGFSKLLNDMYAGMFKTLIVIRMDRLSRRIDDFMKIKNILKAHDVKVIYVKEPQLNFNEENYISTFIQNMVMAVSTFEPDNIADRTSFGKAQARKAGKYKFGSSIPYGFTKDEDDKQLLVDEKRAEIIRNVFDQYLKYKTNSKTTSLNDIVGYLQTAENQLLLQETQSTNSKTASPVTSRTFKQTNIYDMIQRPIYAGLILLDPQISLREMIYYDHQKEKYDFLDENFVQCTNINGRIIEENYWKEILIKHFEDKLDEPTESKSYLFKNLLYCSKCKSLLKRIDDRYACKNECIVTTEDILIEAIIRKMIQDIDSSSIEKIIEEKMSEVKNQINLKKIKLNNLNNELQKELYDNIINPSTLDESNKSLYIQKVNSKDELKKEIDHLGSQFRQYKDRIESMNLFKFQMSDFKEEDFTFIKNNWEFVHSLLSKIMVKAVVRSKKQNGCEAKIKYTDK